MQDALSGKRLQFWLGLLVSLICLGAIFLFIKPSEIVDAVKSARLDLLILVVFSLIAFMALRAVRWRFMLRGGWSSIADIRYSAVFNIQNIGYLLNNILPFRLGDVARAVLIGSVPPITISQGLSTMVVERVLDLLFMIILFPFTIAAVGTLPGEIQTAFLSIGVLAIITAIVLIIAANQRPRARRLTTRILDRITFLDTTTWTNRLDSLLLGLDTLTRPKDAVTLLILSIVLWLPIIGGYYFGMKAVNLQPSLVDAAFIVCIAAFSVAAPSSPGQVGVFEAGVTFAMTTILGMPKAEAASFAFIYHATNYIVLGILGVFGIFRTGMTFLNLRASTRGIAVTKAELSTEPVDGIEPTTFKGQHP